MFAGAGKDLLILQSIFSVFEGLYGGRAGVCAQFSILVCFLLVHVISPFDDEISDSKVCCWNTASLLINIISFNKKCQTLTYITDLKPYNNPGD